MISEFLRTQINSSPMFNYIAGLLLFFIAWSVSWWNPCRNNRSSTPSPEYFGPFVKHLTIGGAYWPEHDLTKFLQTCHNLVDLALWTHIPILAFLPIFRMLSLNRLSTNLTGLTFNELTSPALASITHLDITASDHRQAIWFMSPMVVHHIFNPFNPPGARWKDRRFGLGWSRPRTLTRLPTPPNPVGYRKCETLEPEKCAVRWSSSCFDENRELPFCELGYRCKGGWGYVAIRGGNFSSKAKYHVWYFI